MEKLLNSIESIRAQNINFKKCSFIPEAALFEILSESAIKLSLTSLGVPVHEIRDLTASILRGARKCFAILILIDNARAISSFFVRDSLQRSHPDDRLPYTSEALQQIFEEQSTEQTIERFLKMQWEFTVPILRQHMVSRRLEAEVVLPFLSENLAGEGSMGKAWMVELHPQCHQLPIENHKVIRKQIKCGKSDDKANFQKELENLSLLTHLQHPNIVQLYCSYLYRQDYNLIFAVADGGSLADFLMEQHGTKGPEGIQVLLALTELASAVDALHNFTSEILDLSLSGCHHDLAPRNILIHGDTFLLADFGLSTFINAEEDSLTTFKDVPGSYVAPECQTLDHGYVKSQKIGRASDIWSFGCILSEVLTHMLMGPEGVSQFRNKRSVWVTDDFEWLRFHRGPGKPNSEVGFWLDGLQANREPYYVRMVSLIREMLLIDPKTRPGSAQVLEVLRGIYILSIANSVSLGLGSACNTHKSIDFILGNMRFQGWLVAFNCLLDEIDRKKLGNHDFDFPKTVMALKETYSILEYNEQGTAGAKQSLLRYQHTRLMEALPPYYHSVAKEHLVKQVLQSETEQLGRLSAAFTEAGEEDIGVLVAVKSLTALSEAGRLSDQSNLVIDLKSVKLKEDVDIHQLARLEPTSELALVEWLMYKELWADEVIGTELRHRLTSVASLLHSQSTASIPGSLYCKGFFHDPSYRAFGFVYSFPPSEKTPITLHQLLSTVETLRHPPYKRKVYHPLLEYRFRLAFDICHCIYTFHRVGWLHRNLHSKNVLFFPQKGAQNAEWAKEPRILGFSRSRQNWLFSFTYGPDDNGEVQKYQHPEYLTHKERYQEEYDYYSVGILLLEIGLWSTLSEITNSSTFRDISNEDFRRKLIERRVPQLGFSMGTHYMEATQTCLEGGFARSSRNSEDGGDTFYMSFKNLVMDRIPVMNKGTGISREFDIN